jgi:hypothetical protein
MVEIKMVNGVLAMLCLGQMAFAGSYLPAETYARIAFSTNEIRLPQISPYGWCKVDAALACHFFASCPYQVNVSFDGFIGQDGTVIGGENAAVQVNGVSVPVGRHSVPLFSSRESTPRGGIDMPIKIGFSFGDLSRHAGGTYNGEITFTVFGSG